MSDQTAAKTIIVASDSASVADRFVAALDSAGHQAIAVRSEGDLRRRVSRDGGSVDLIVLDLRLPGADGVGLVRILQQEAGVEVPVLVFAGTVRGAADVRDLADLGVAGYLNEHSAVQHILPSIAPHLFPDSFNRRSGPRVALSVSVQYRCGTTMAAALTLAVGSGGLAIRTTTPLESGSGVTVRFRMPGTRRDVEAEGRVIWSDRRVGMGVQFERVEPVDQAIIDNFVEAHGYSRRRPAG